MGSPPSLFNGSCCNVVKRMTQEDALYAIIAVENSMLKTQDQEFPLMEELRAQKMGM